MTQLSILPNHHVIVPTDLLIGSKYCPSPELDSEEVLIVDQALDYYRHRLWLMPDVLEVLEQEHGITDLGVLKSEKAGFCDRTLGKHLPRKGSFESEEARGILVRNNIFRRSGSETFRGCVTLELRGMFENTVGMSGLPIYKGRKEKPVSHVLWGKSAMGIVNPHGLRESHAVIVNDPMDACRHLCEGTNAVALMGTMDSQEEFLDVLKYADISSADIQHDQSPMGRYWAKELSLALSQLDIEHQCYE